MFVPSTLIGEVQTPSYSQKGAKASAAQPFSVNLSMDETKTPMHYQWLSVVKQCMHKAINKMSFNFTQLPAAE